MYPVGGKDVSAWFDSRCTQPISIWPKFRDFRERVIGMHEIIRDGKLAASGRRGRIGGLRAVVAVRAARRGHGATARRRSRPGTHDCTARTLLPALSAPWTSAVERWMLLMLRFLHLSSPAHLLRMRCTCAARTSPAIHAPTMRSRPWHRAYTLAVNWSDACGSLVVLCVHPGSVASRAHAHAAFRSRLACTCRSGRTVAQAAVV